MGSTPTVPATSECSSKGRARGLGPRCCRFESCHSDHHAALAQLVEHSSCKRVVVGSSPTGSPIILAKEVIDIDLIGAFDQLDATLRDFAPVIYNYKKNLEEQGFTSEEAMQLVIAFQQSVLKP